MAELGDLPLFAWGASLPADRAGRRLLRRRAALVGAGLLCVMLTIPLPPRPLLLWNVSASAPVGLYLVTPGDRPRRGDLVIAWPPAAARDLALRRRYLGPEVPLVKRVAAVGGETVCAHARAVRVNGAAPVQRLANDRAGRPMPHWYGCRRLAPGAVFLLTADKAESFDGRYFGPTLAGDIIGTATPLWLR